MEGEQLNDGRRESGTGTVRTGEVGTRGNTNPIRATAFSRGYKPGQHTPTNHGTSGNGDAEIKANGTSSGSTGISRTDGLIREDEGGTRGGVSEIRSNPQPNIIDIGRSERVESGSAGVSGSVNATQRRRGRPFGSTKNKPLDTANTSNGAELVEEEHSLNGIEITVESAAMDELELVDKPEKKARIKRPKEPPRNKVEEVSASLKDVYQIVDMVTESVIKFLGKGEMYPKDLMCLDDDVAQRLARNLVQLNDSMPRLAARFNAVSVPAMLISTLATDIFGKGVMLYAIVKSPNIGQ